MSLLQKACETFDAHQNLVGVEREGHVTLAPIGHVVTNADLEITLNADGKFISARNVDKNEPKICIPVTEGSAGRTNSPSAHPLCDRLDYISQEDEKKHSLYMLQLKNWVESDFSHPKLLPVYNYCKSGTVYQDLVNAGLLEPKQNKRNMMIRWVVTGLGEASGPVWRDSSLFSAFSNWYVSQIISRDKDLCMVTGRISIPAEQHVKGIISKYGTAKLISANDDEGFTYRGRFDNDEQACIVSYEASQKAHNALRWLASEQGFSESGGGRTFICWNPQGKKLPRVLGPMHRTDDSKPLLTPSDYKRDLQLSLLGYRSQLNAEDGVVIAAFDASTKGRLSLTYYNELLSSDFLDRLMAWDETCCWYRWYKGAFGIQSPSLYSIAQAAFGTERGSKGKEKLELDDLILKQQIQRLLACRIDRAMFPTDIERALVQHASTPLAYTVNNREQVVYIACAAIRKFYSDRYKEEIPMALEPQKKDRSYQFGRLLALMEKAERDTYSQTDKDRETNAIRMQSVFCQRPLYASRIIEEQLKKAYFPRLTAAARTYYEKQMGDAFAIISDCPENEVNRPLADIYLIGYYLQKKELYTSRKNKEEE